jgi:MinD-like ATPase involved in chromosome partitioning or flagellar assembly/uncharacterized membrane-anchored protein YhcB (DUF1043 family)
MTGKSGRIITFYSYKGGTGRTMAVSNLAWILASNGYDVLLIDWDLEAPGLHRYLRPFLVDPELSSTSGLIDFVWDVARVNVTPSNGEGVPSNTMEFPSLEDYVVGLDCDFLAKGSISFIPAGRQDENYAQRVNTFNWGNFYERLGGGRLLQAEADGLRINYDYILIDSRTGVSDTSGICTVQMPDLLVVLFTLNRQSINGAAAVAASVRAQRGEAFPIFPVPTRIENAETDKLAAAIAYSRRVFAPFLNHVQSKLSKIDLSQQAAYWNQVETPYRTFYAFEEVPAAFRDEPGSHHSVLAANEGIAYWITDRIVTSLHPEREELRQKVVDAYAFTEDEVRKFERVSQPSGESPIGRLAQNVGRALKRRAWQCATITLASVAIFVALALAFTQSELRTTQNDLKTAQSELRTTQNDLKTAQSELRTTQNNLKTAQSDLNTTQNRLENTQERLKNAQAQIGRLNGRIATLQSENRRLRSGKK